MAARDNDLNAGVALQPLDDKPAQKTGATCYNDSFVGKFRFVRVHAPENIKFAENQPMS